MVEIVFSESACGSLKIAQTYGRGKYRGSAISVFIRHENGSVPSSNEMKEAQLQAQEQECIAWHFPKQYILVLVLELVLLSFHLKMEHARFRAL